MISKYDSKKLESTVEDWQEFNDILLLYRIKEIIPHVADGPVLDVGCGRGEISELLAEDYTVVGIDPGELPEGKATYIKGELEGMEFNHTFGTIICSHVIEHSDNPYSFLIACRAVLKSGGTLIVTCPNALSLHKRLGDFMKLSKPYELSVTDEMQHHKHTFGRYRLHALLIACGFEVTVEKGIMLKPFSSAQMNKYLDSRWHDAFHEIGKNEDLIDYCSSLLMVARKK